MSIAAPTEVSVDASDLAGQTVRLRLAEVAAVAPLRAGVDDIREPLAAGAGIKLPDLEAAPDSAEASPVAGAVPVAVAGRFINARNAHDAATALSLLADTVSVPLMADNQLASNFASGHSVRAASGNEREEIATAGFVR